MEWNVVPTGIKELDAMLGGGVLDDSVLLIIYDTNSFGWVLSVKLFKSFLDRGCFGVGYKLLPANRVAREVWWYDGV